MTRKGTHTMSQDAIEHYKHTIEDYQRRVDQIEAEDPDEQDEIKQMARRALKLTIAKLKLELRERAGVHLG